MTTYGAYDAGLPCKNPSCASHGKPHPNCRCYGDMAEGGEVRHFCSVDQAHQPECEYFADGGAVGEGTDEPPPAATAEATSEGGTDEPPPGMSADAGTDEPPPEPNDLGQRSTAAMEGLATGVAGPAATAAEVGYGEMGESGKLAARHVLKHVLPGGVGALAGTLLDAVSEEGISPEDIKSRADTYSLEHGAGEAVGTIGSLMTGTGEAGLIVKASEAATGSKMLQGALQGGLFQASDEVGKWALGQGDPQDAAGAKMAAGARILFSGLLGGAGGKVASSASAGLESLAEVKLAQKASSFLRGLGFAAKSQDPALREVDAQMAAKAGDLTPQAYKAGVKFFDKFFNPAITAGAGFVEGAREGFYEDGAFGALVGGVLGATGGLLLGKAWRKLGSVAGKKVIGPAVFKVLSSGNVKGMAQAFDHVAEMSHGSNMVDKTIDGMFKTSPYLGSKATSSVSNESVKNAMDVFLGDGGMTQSVQQDVYDSNSGGDDAGGMAEGGEVQAKTSKPAAVPGTLNMHQGVAMHYPDQHMLLTMARGRVSNYLMGMRPQANQPKLPFDAEPDMKQKKKAYDKALHIAVDPMSVLHDIHKGTAEADQVKHLQSMYPELTTLVQKRITSKITEAQLSGTRPSSRVRQGLSMLLGTALSSELTPAAIQAAQSTFQANRGGPSKPQPSQGPKGAPKHLSKTEQSYLTGSQALEKRSQRGT